MRRPLRQYWRARHVRMVKLSSGSALALLSVAGTMLAVLLWLEVSLTAAAITYALTLGTSLMILHRRARAEARAAKPADGIVASESRDTTDCETKKIV